MSSSGYSSSDTAQDSQKPRRRHHTASYFFGFCMKFVTDETNNGRRFRTDRQGFEAASLKWQRLSPEEKQNWQRQYRDEKIKVRNGDRGHPSADPATLAILKNPALKSAADIDGLIRRWTFNFVEKSELATEKFLIVSATTNNRDPFYELAIVEFNFARGILDQFRIPFGKFIYKESIKARYDLIRLILDWPRHLNRSLSDGIPNYFVPTGQMESVFNTLAFIDRSSPRFPPINWESNPQISLRHLAPVQDLRSAIFKYLNTSAPINREESKDEPKEIEMEEIDCLEIAQKSAQLLIEEFGPMLQPPAFTDLDVDTQFPNQW